MIYQKKLVREFWAEALKVLFMFVIRSPLEVFQSSLRPMELGLVEIQTLAIYVFLQAGVGTRLEKIQDQSYVLKFVKQF